VDVIPYEDEDDSANPEKKKARPLLQAAFKGSVEEVQSALLSGVPISR